MSDKNKAKDIYAYLEIHFLGENFYVSFVKNMVEEVISYTKFIQ